MKLPKKLSLPHLSPAGIKQRWQKLFQKEAYERSLEPRRLRIVTFSLTFVSMAMGLSFIPLFPQPLPILIAFMVAAVAYGYPEVGLPIGCGVIGAGLIYQLSGMNFISMASGDPFVRMAFIIVWLLLFIIPPIIFHRQKAAIAIDLGVLAAMLLFFDQTYFLAIPIILTAGVLFNKKATLTVLYTVLIFVPLLLMQYLGTILKIARTDWWLDPASVPAIYAPLSGIFKDLQQSMVQFRLYDTNKIVTTITDQIYATPNPTRLTLMDALKQYRDSLPGIMLFLAIVAALVLAIFLIIKTLAGNSMEKLLPVITATSAATLFFVLLAALQRPLAISAKADGLTALGAVLATVIMTLPTSIITYSPKKKATNEMLLEKAKELLSRLQTFEENLKAVKNGIPVDVTTVEGKMLIIKDKLNDTFAKASSRYYDASESDRKFEELDKILSVQIEELFSELDTVLREYHTLVNCEYTAWVGKIKAAGLEVEPAKKTEFQKEMPIETRIACIKAVLEAGRLLANQVIIVVERIYGVIRSLYDPNLPEESRAISFAKEKLAEKTTPWVAIDSLLASLNNWRRQYAKGIIKSVETIRESLNLVTALKSRGAELRSALGGDNFTKIMDLIKASEDLKIGIEEKNLNVAEVTTVSEAFQSSLGISTDVILILHQELLDKEKAIESLLPKKNYLWEKNITLKERMTSAAETVSDPQKHGLKYVLEELPKFLSYAEECVTTIASYNERKELLLNYPTAKAAIENQLTTNNQVFAKDLPFETKYSSEFLRLFYSHKYPEFSIDEENMVLARKPEKGA